MADGKPKLLFSLPSFEPATTWWTDCAKNVVPQYLQGKPVDVELLIGNQAWPDAIHERMQKDEYKALGGVGHGSNDKFTAQNYSIVYWTANRDYLRELRNKVFAPVSCLVGNALLPAMVEEGLGCGQGEITEYYVMDSGILSFVRSDTVFWVRLALGDKAKDAFDISLATYEEEAKAAEQKGNVILARLLRYNAANRKFFGDPNWRLITTPPPQPPSPPQPPAPPEEGEYEVEVTIPQTTLKLRVKARKIA